MNEFSESASDGAESAHDREMPVEAEGDGCSLDSVLAAELSTAGLCAHLWQDPPLAVAAQANLDSYHALALLELAWGGERCFHAATRAGAAVLGNALLVAQSVVSRRKFRDRR